MRAPAWFTAAVESACNTLLGLDPEMRVRMAELADKTIAVELLGLNLSLYFFPHAAGVQVSSSYEGEPDVTLRGPPLSLLRMALSDAPSDALFAGSAELRGDVATGQAFQEILRSLRVDWEELLARLTGDDIAHQAGRAARAMAAQTRDGARTLGADAREYLTEEAHLLANRSQITRLLDDIDTLRSDADRLEARMRRLEAAVSRKD